MPTVLEKIDLDAASLIAAAECAAWDEERRIANEAAEVLGYTALRDAIRLPEQKAEILRVFKKLGLAPFKPECVTAYKAEAIVAAKRKHGLSAKDANAGVTVRLAPVSSGLSFHQMLTATQSMIMGTPSRAAFRGEVRIDWRRTVLAKPVPQTSAREGMYSTRASDFAGWMITDDRAVATAPIPAFALKTALDVKRECPGVEVFVEELVEQKVVDPFLGVRYGGQDYYLEVWNEPGFKAERATPA